jgi:hypothetical protein
LMEVCMNCMCMIQYLWWILWGSWEVGIRICIVGCAIT